MSWSKSFNNQKDPHQKCLLLVYLNTFPANHIMYKMAIMLCSLCQKSGKYTSEKAVLLSACLTFNPTCCGIQPGI